MTLFIIGLLVGLLTPQVMAVAPVRVNAKTSLASNRIASYPYISGDDFRLLCDHHVDETQEQFVPENVKKGDTIFVKVDYLDIFFSKCHPRIGHQYILITHNSDLSVPSGSTASNKQTKDWGRWLDDEKLFVWLSTNIDALHPKLMPIPIGIENAHWGKKYPHILRQIACSGEDKNVLLSGNFTIDTNPVERKPLFDLFINKSFCNLAKERTIVGAYLRDVKQSKFVLSPPGNGIDCHRTWEALYLGAIPVVKSSCLDPMFAQLPVVIVHDWQEITEEFLEKKYDELNHRQHQLEKLRFDYWRELVHAYQNRCRQK